LGRRTEIPVSDIDNGVDGPLVVPLDAVGLGPRPGHGTEGRGHSVPLQGHFQGRQATEPTGAAPVNGNGLTATGSRMAGWQIDIPGLSRSSDPRCVFASLAKALAVLGYRCLVQVSEQGRTSPPISQLAPDQEAAAVELTALPEPTSPVISNGRAVVVRFHGPVADGIPAPFAGALAAFRADGQPVSTNDAQIIHARVDHAVSVVTLEQLQLQLEAQHSKADHLQQALTTSREIGVAVGIVMSSRSCSTDDAFDALRSASQRSNRKIRDIAADVTSTREPPPETVTRRTRRHPTREHP